MVEREASGRQHPVFKANHLEDNFPIEPPRVYRRRISVSQATMVRLLPLAHRERFDFQRPVGYSEIPVSTVAASDGWTN